MPKWTCAIPYSPVLCSYQLEMVELNEPQRGNKMKLNLGNKQVETLQEVMNLAINFLEGMEEYKADQKKYEALQASINNQLYKGAK